MQNIKKKNMTIEMITALYENNEYDDFKESIHIDKHFLF